MPYNLQIPGQVTEYQLKAIEIVAGIVPKHGKIVEVGSLFGSSSWAWAKSVDPSVTVYCIDPWEKNEGVRSIEARYGITYGIEQFKRNTSDCLNIRPLQGYSPINFQDWSDPIDLYFEDAVHVDPILTQNLNFWSGKLKPSGIICGDDYRPRFPDVRRGAEELGRRLGRELIRVDFFWCLLPSETALPGSAVVANRLKELGIESDALKRSRGISVVAGPRQPITDIGAGECAIVPCRVANDGIDEWPLEAGGRLGLGVRIVPTDHTNEVLVESRVSLPVAQLAPDIPIDGDLVLPTATLPVGHYLAIFDVLGPNGKWTTYPSVSSTRGTPIVVRTRSSPTPCNEPLVENSRGQRKAVLQRERAPYQFGDTIQFDAEGQSQIYTRNGWVPSEARHRWMSGESSRLVLDVEWPNENVLAGATVRLAVKLQPFVVSGKLVQQSLTITVNGILVFEDAIDVARVVETTLPAKNFFLDEPIEIVFYHPDATRPCDVLPTSSDKKYLSFAVSELRLSLDPHSKAAT